MEKKSKTQVTAVERQLQQRALMSKIQGVTNHLRSLMQKKLRLDLEIKRTRYRLKSLKDRTTKFQSISEMTEADFVPLGPAEFKLHEEERRLERLYALTLDQAELYLNELSHMDSAFDYLDMYTLD